MKRRSVLGGGALAALSGAGGSGGPVFAAAPPVVAPAALPAASATGLPAVLQKPALQTPLAPGAAMLALARAGKRLVAAGERGIVQYSDDEGRRWTQARVPVQVNLTALRFADEHRGWAAGHLGVLLATADGGATWSLQLEGVQAAQRTLRAASDEAQRKSAQRLLDDGPDKPFFDIDVQGTQLLAVGAYGLAFESADSGSTWSPLAQRLPNPKRLHLYGVKQIGERVVIAGEQGLLLRSTDRGATFAALPSPYKGSFFGLLAARSGTLVAYGLRGNAFRSADFGSSWTPIETGAPMSISAGIERADGTLVLLAQNGDLLLSRDDGRHFERRPAAPPFPAAALAAADGDALVLAGLRGIKRLEKTA